MNAYERQLGLGAISGAGQMQAQIAEQDTRPIAMLGCEVDFLEKEIGELRNALSQVLLPEVPMNTAVRGSESPQVWSQHNQVLMAILQQVSALRHTVRDLRDRVDL